MTTLIPILCAVVGVAAGTAMMSVFLGISWEGMSNSGFAKVVAFLVSATGVGSVGGTALTFWLLDLPHLLLGSMVSGALALGVPLAIFAAFQLRYKASIARRDREYKERRHRFRTDASMGELRAQIEGQTLRVKLDFETQQAFQLNASLDVLAYAPGMSGTVERFDRRTELHAEGPTSLTFACDADWQQSDRLGDRTEIRVALYDEDVIVWAGKAVVEGWFPVREFARPLSTCELEDTEWRAAPAYQQDGSLHLAAGRGAVTNASDDLSVEFHYERDGNRLLMRDWRDVSDDPWWPVDSSDDPGVVEASWKIEKGAFSVSEKDPSGRLRIHYFAFRLRLQGIPQLVLEHCYYAHPFARFETGPATGPAT
ncbi:MAG: hypothetical protein AAGE52_29960 [Myxococcota bacterium]